MSFAALIPGLGQLVGGAISGLVGGSQKAKGRRMMKNMQFPEEQMPDEVLRNQQLAEEMAAGGMPSEQYAQAMKNIQRQQIAALRAAGDRRSSMGLISSIQQGTNDATLNLDAANADMRNANKRNLINVNNNVANWKSSLFDKNIRSKYDRDYNYAMSLIGAGNQNLMGGIDRGLASIPLFLGSGNGYRGNNPYQQGGDYAGQDYNEDNLNVG